MTVMKEKAVKDLAQYSAEMKELERVIAHERRLKQFMTTKCSERSVQDEGQDQSRRHGTVTATQPGLQSSHTGWLLGALECNFIHIYIYLCICRHLCLCVLSAR